MAAVLDGKRHSMHEVARLLNVHVATVWRWHLHGVRGRKLLTVVVGARRYVLASDLDAFLAAGNPGRAADSDSNRRRRSEDAAKALDGRGIGVRRRH